MWRCLLRWFGSVALGLALTVTVWAQLPGPSAPEPSAPPPPPGERSVPAPQHALAAMAALLVLFILCAPSRKS